MKCGTLGQLVNVLRPVFGLEPPSDLHCAGSNRYAALAGRTGWRSGRPRFDVKHG